MDRYFEAALRAHSYLVAAHWRDGALVGPDSGVRINYRVGRFVKGYLDVVPWHDAYAYVQTQGYWILSNWWLYRATGDARFRDIALRCSRYLTAVQREDGAWKYPNPEWKGRIATIEGTWGSLGLLETYRHTGVEAFLEAVLRWHRFLVSQVGFQDDGDEIAVNYFAGRPGARVPNNSCDVLRFLGELAQATGDRAYLERTAGLVAFIRNVQKPSGEFPYAVPGSAGGTLRSHFQCFQYNAFQCIGLARYHKLTGDPAVRPVVEKVAAFLRTGLALDGHVHYSCQDHSREVVYHTAVTGAAFTSAARLSLEGCEEPARRAFEYVLGRQRADGSFPFSVREHRVLQDRRAYPRNIAMIQHHLLLQSGFGECAGTVQPHLG
jgi:hypothetical protein